MLVDNVFLYFLERSLSKVMNLAVSAFYAAASMYATGGSQHQSELPMQAPCCVLCTRLQFDEYSFVS
jgi:hypothetical protein